MKEAGKPMHALGKKMEVLGKQIDAEARTAEKAMRALIKDAHGEGPGSAGAGRLTSASAGALRCQKIYGSMGDLE